MTRPRTASALLALATACVAGRGGGRPSNEATAAVDRALSAMGGAAAVSGLDALVVKGSVEHLEPEQSVKAGGEPRAAGRSTFVLTRSLSSSAARIEWVRALVYPSPREYRFTEIVTPEAGYVEGLDTSAPTRAMQESKPPRHAMSGVRLAAARRELLRSSPRLLADLHAQPDRLAPAPDEEAGGVRLPAVTWRAPGGVTLTVLFDRATGLPARIRTLDADTIAGDSRYDLVLEDWRPVGGVKVAHRQRYELNGAVIARIQWDEVQAGGDLAPTTFAIPEAIRASAPPPATGAVPYQWVLRRQHIGTYLDSDAVMFDPQASPGLRLVELAPGVAQVVGGSHNSLVVELADGLVVIDAPVGEVQSRWTLDALAARHPGKPVKALALTHHHMDHAGGARTYVAAGAQVIVGAGNGAHFQRAFRAPHRVDGDALERAPRQADVVEVQDRLVLGAGDRTVELHRIDNPHAEGMLLAWVPSARLGFVADLWSPGRDKLGEKPTPGQAAVVAAVRRLGIAPERMAGGHGSVAEYAPLDALAGPGGGGAAPPPGGSPRSP